MLKHFSLKTKSVRNAHRQHRTNIRTMTELWINICWDVNSKKIHSVSLYKKWRTCTLIRCPLSNRWAIRLLSIAVRNPLFILWQYPQRSREEIMRSSSKLSKHLKKTNIYWNRAIRYKNIICSYTVYVYYTLYIIH